MRNDKKNLQKIGKLQHKVKNFNTIKSKNSTLQIKYMSVVKKLEKREKQIQDAIEYIENNSLYDQDYDYDYEENMVEYPPTDEYARNDLLKILKL